MTTTDWQLKNPIEAIVFDCDGTLSAIEGVNELAKNSGVHQIIEELTHKAMSVAGLNPELYQKRLDLQVRLLEVSARKDCFTTEDEWQFQPWSG